MQQTIKIALLATGDELTQGSVLNTNGQIIAQELFSQGFNPECQMTVPDDVEAIELALDVLLEQHDIVITTGGLGPTSDDKTRFALASFLKQPLVAHQKSVDTLEERYKKINIPFTELSRQQALFPEDADILENTVGSANGCVCRVSADKLKMIFMLPGPPRECLPMFRESVLPQLIPLLSDKRVLLQWKVFGIAEGLVAEKVDTAIQPYTSICRTSFRWDYPYVDCKVLLAESAPEREQIFALLNPILSPYQLSSANQRATERLKNVLIQQNVPILIKDEATGGVLESLIHVPANHKNAIFGPLTQEAREVSNFFRIEGLKNYWNSEGGEDSELVLTSKTGTEKFIIPFRKALLEIYAAEFIAHQILIHLNK
jgi:nicotinamide-nucleotide amidase